MTDLVAPRRYYFACHFLWATFSAWQYMLEDVIAVDYDALPQEWDDLHNTLAAWLIQESLDTAWIYLHVRTFDTLNQVANPRSDAIVIQWGATAQRISQQAYTRYSSIDRSLWVYFCYCRWLWYTLAMFDQLFHAVPLYASIFVERYRKQQPSFRRLAYMLDKEHPALSDVDMTRTAPSQTLYGTINAQGKELAHAWRETLDTTA